MYKFVLIINAFAIISLFSSCNNATGNEGGSGNQKSVASGSETKVADDLPKEKEVKIGDQIWMTSNLNVDKFRNGDEIPEVKTTEEWETASKKGKPAWCYYENDPKNAEKYGKIYNWYAIKDARGLAPEGWRVPSNEDWEALIEVLGEEAGKKIKSKNGWEENGNGTNEAGFFAFPGGYRSGGGNFTDLGKYSAWWSASSYTDIHAYGRCVHPNQDYIDDFDDHKGNGFSIRCLKGESKVKVNTKKKEKTNK